MKARFWGTRGSIPVSLTASDVRRKLVAALRTIREGGRWPGTDAEVHHCVEALGFELAGTYGGHSSCVEIEAGDDRIVCDLGSGARALGQSMLERFGPGRPRTYHVFLSHVHWDHIMGFPFFAPSYIPGNRIVIHGCHRELEAAFRRQHGAPSFPVDFDALGAKIEFDVIPAGETREVAGFSVRAMKQRHAGDSYGWRFERGGKVLVYSTDSEHRLEDAAEMTAFADFFRDADLVIFDAMYSLADAVTDERGSDDEQRGDPPKQQRLRRSRRRTAPQVDSVGEVAREEEDPRGCHQAE